MSSIIDQILQQAVTCHQSGQLLEAERLYRTVLQMQPNQPDAHYHLGLLALQASQTSVGLIHFKQALDANPAQRRYWLSYIDALIQVEQMDKASQVLRAGRQAGLSGADFDALEGRLAVPSQAQLNALLTLFNQGRYNEMEKYARTMTALYPKLGMAWKALGTALLKQERGHEALAAMQQAAVLLPEDAGVYNNLGSIFNDLGRLVEAEASLRQALQLKPDFAEAHYNLGNTFQEQGRPAEAELCYQRALEINPNYAEAHYNLGNVFLAQNRFSESENCHLRALELKPDIAEAFMKLSSKLREYHQQAEVRTGSEFVDEDISAGADFNKPYPHSFGTAQERVVFMNNIGGVGDTLPMPLLVQWYKKHNPEDTTILHDALFFGYYFEPFSGIDEVIRSSESHPNYFVRSILHMDPNLPRSDGIPLRETRFTKVVNTNHANGRRMLPDDKVIRMDFYTTLYEIIQSGFHSFGAQLRAEHQANVDAIVRELTADGRMLIGMQTRGACPPQYNGLMLPRADYVRDLTTIASKLVERYGARILICGDDRLLSEDRYASRDWIALDTLVPNIYYKLEIMKRTHLFLAATSGFSLLVNLMRSPEQIPTIQIYTNPQSLLGTQIKKVRPNWEKDGGGRVDLQVLTASFRHPDLKQFLFDDPHTPEKVLNFVARFLD